jgi:hypothetical protein
LDIEILVFKGNGKYYTSDTVHNDEDIWLFKDEFIKFIKDNNPAKIEDGYIVVKDASDNQTFHYALYKYNEIY